MDNECIELDPCAGVACPPGFVCEDGGCLPRVDDDFEDNDELASASRVEPGAWRNLVVLPQDDDWFVFELCRGGTLTVTLLFEHSWGDVDLAAYDAQGGLLGRSIGTEDTERVTASVAEAQPVFVRVYGFAGAANTYSMQATMSGCQPDECGPDRPCPPAHDCQDGVCVFVGECQVDQDCADQERCWEQLCVPADFCRGDGDCPEGQRCDPFASRCVALDECAEHEDCPDGLLCIGATCQRIEGCRRHEDCPEGTVCTEGGVCFVAPDCREDRDCDAEERCEWGYCQPFVCADDRECEVGWQCLAGRCYPPLYCGEDEDCGGGWRCVNNVCTNPGGCVQDEDCPANQYCLNGMCIWLPDPECERDRDCPPGHECNYGLCEEVFIPCGDIADCPIGTICQGGQCVQGDQCRRDRDCGPGQRCTDEGRCEAIPDACDAATPVRFDRQGHANLVGTTAPASSLHEGSCVGRGNEVVYRLRVQEERLASVRVAASPERWDPGLYIRRASCAMGLEVACNDDFEGLDPGVDNVLLLPGEDYFLFVDAFSVDDGGPYVLTIELREPDPGACEGDDDCPQGQVCEQRQCVAVGIPCGPGGECPPEMVCGPGGFCEAGCGGDGDCEEGQRCDQGVCRLPQPCDRDLDCPASYVCEDNICEFTMACVESRDCAGDNYACVGSQCVAPIACNSDRDCSGYLIGLSCSDGFCQSPGGCVSDDQCGNACVWGFCSPLRGPECVYDHTCGQGRTCEGRSCR